MTHRHKSFVSTISHLPLNRLFAIAYLCPLYILLLSELVMDLSSCIFILSSKTLRTDVIYLFLN